MSLEYTPVEEIPAIVKSLNKSFRQSKPSLEFRLNQLRQLYYALKVNEDLLIRALKLDLNKSEEDTHLTELIPIYSDLLLIIKNLPTWTKPRSVISETSLLFKFSNPKVEYTPFGTVLVISPFNFPLLLSLQPVIGAIAAGNCVVLKQSELVPNTAQTLSDILIDALDPKLFQIVNGAIPETTKLLEQKFDKILYTGSGSVGRIIAQAAVKNLTPYVLELGGKSPAFVTPSVKSQIETVCKRIAFTRFTNAGQVCVATDYTIVHDDIYDLFISTMRKIIKKYYNLNVQNSGKLVNTAAWDRVMKLIRDTKGDVVLGGDGSREDRFIEPTLISNVKWDDISMQSEIFGPVLPVVKYSDLQSAIDNVQDVADTPLALYIYSTSKTEQQLISSQIRSGALVINDGMVHVGLATLPFGGIGESGQGQYHGKWSFETFSHQRALMKQPFWTEILFESKYPPITKFDLSLTKWFLVPRPTFGRFGKVRDHNYEFLIKVVFVAIIGVYSGYHYS